MKMLVGIIAALLIAVLGTTDAAAQYSICNSSPVPISATVRFNCVAPAPPVVILPGTCTVFTMPTNCMALGVIVNGVFYAVGTNGPTVPPNPPNWIIVGPTSTSVW